MNNMLINVPIHHNPLKIPTDSYMDVQPCIIVAPDNLHISIKFQLCSPTQSKAALILNNFIDYHLPGLKCTLKTTTLATKTHSMLY